MITETELRDVILDIADDAPLRCSSIKIGHHGRRHFFAGAAAAAVVLIAAGVTAGAVGIGSTHDSDRASPPSDSRAPAVATATGSTSGTVSHGLPLDVPNAKQRRQLRTYALHNATINGDRHPTVHVVGTTFDRAYKKLPMSFNTGPEAKEARQLGLSSVHAAVWIIWYQGHFYGGDYAMADLIGQKGLRGGMGTADVDSGYGVNPNIVLAPLGKVVRLI